MPLSGKGLCEALTTPAALAPRRGARAATPGVGRTPRSTTSAPPLAAPAHRALASISPERRVSRPMRILSPKAREAARPRRRASSGSRALFATPRTPSVPNVMVRFLNLSPIPCPGRSRSPGAACARKTRSTLRPRRARTRRAHPDSYRFLLPVSTWNGPLPPRGRSPTRRSALAALTLGELRTLSGLLEAILLALHRPGVTGEQPCGFQLAPGLLRLFGESPRYTVAQGFCLARGTAAFDLGYDLVAAGRTKELERRAHRCAVSRTREVFIHVAAVHGDLAVAREYPYPCNGCLAPSRPTI